MTNLIRFPELGISFSLNRVAMSFGNFDVYWYGIIIALGFLLGALYAMKSAKKMKLNSDYLFDAIFVGLIAGVIGARLYYVVFCVDDRFIQNPLSIFDIRDGGLGIYGGIIFALLAAYFVAKWRKMSIGSVLDIGSLGFLIGQGIGRWGNFVNQEAFGCETTLPWGMRSTSTELIAPYANVHPCFLYESILCLLGFVVLHIFTRKFRKYDGQTFLLYVIWYGISRFFVEGLRTDSLYIPYTSIRISQAVALISVAAAIVILVKFKNRTSLTGCGNKAIMELNNINLNEVPEEVLPEQSTVFSGEKYMYEPTSSRTYKKTEETENQEKTEDDSNEQESQQDTTNDTEDTKDE